MYKRQEHSKEPRLSAFADRTAGPGAHVQARRAARAVGESRGDILFHLRDRPTAFDVSVVTASAATYCTATADTDGTAAAARNAAKHATYARRADTGNNFLPFSVETHGRLGRPPRDFLRTLGRRSADTSGGLLTSQQFVDGVLRDFDDALPLKHGHRAHSRLGFRAAAGSSAQPRRGLPLRRRRGP